MQALLETLRTLAPIYGPALAQATFARGLAVTAPDGTTRAIPVTATPIILPEAELRRRAEGARQVSSAALKVARCVLKGEQAEQILGALSPLERKVALATWRGVLGLCTTRVDYFVEEGRPFALEVNATIPAMQGYSDIAADAFLERVGALAGLDAERVEELKAQNGSNAQALYQALLGGYAALRGGRSPGRILLLCRRSDAQLTEQRYLADRFCQLGTEAEVVHPDELSGDEVVMARGRSFDLVYRHLFVRRLEQSPSPYVERLFTEYPRFRTVLLNPPSAQVEVKATFALLSRTVAEPGLVEAAGLCAEEEAAVRELVPWTRLLRPGPSDGAAGERVEDLVAHVAADPSRFVLKRSWDYGGKAVFVGRAAGSPQFLERVKAAFGTALDWPALCRKAAVDEVGGGFVVQQFVDAKAEPHLLCTPSQVVPAELYVDFSSYASVQPGPKPAWGGVCRGSPSQIVNIVGGGGVLPLITREVAEQLHRALVARPPLG